MVQMDPLDRLMRAALASDEEFVGALNDILRHDLRISIRELYEKSGIAQSSLYKIMHGKRSPNLSTPVSYTHLRAHETGRNLVCRLLLEKKNKQTKDEAGNV